MSKNTNISELINYLSYDGSGNIVFNTVSSATTNTDKFLVSDTGVLKFRTAAQLLSDIGAQASGSYQAALSGTGFVKISGSTISYDNSTYATQTYVTTAISNLVAAAPTTLDTLNELATALGNDANFATTVSTSIGNRVPYTGANADVVLGSNNLKSKNTFVEGDGLYNGGGLRIKQYAFQTDGIDGYNTISSQTSGFAFSSSRGNGVFNNFILDPTSLPNNTQRSYILPNANGTLALTSDIPTVSGVYVPYTGATANVSLGNYELGAKYITSEGSSGLGGVVNIKQDAISMPKGNGYSSIAANLSSFDFWAYTGASTYKYFQLRFDGLTNGTTRLYTLPNADGTLALTSNLSSYLPLAGGTLTGNLTLPTSGYIDNLASLKYAAYSWASYNTSTGVISFQNATAGGLNINAGAVTISSSLTTSGTINSGDSVTLLGELYFGGTLSNRYFRLVKSGTAESTGVLNYQFYTGASWVTKSTLDYTGAATFNSTLRAASLSINVGQTSDRLFYISANLPTTGTSQFQAVLNGTFVNAATTLYGVYIGNNSNVNVTNSYALFLESTGGTGTITNKYGIYQSGSSDKNYFAGSTGVGTNNPSSIFHVIVPESASNLSGVRIQGDTNSKLLVLGANATYTWIQSHGSVPLRLNELGNELIMGLGSNVGIGTSTITDKLEVRGADNGITISSVIANRPVLKFVNGTATMLKLSANGNYGAIADNTGNDVVFFRNGNVSIGTTTESSGYQFTVAKTARFNGMMLGNGDGSNAADNRIAINWDSGSKAYLLAQQNVPLELGNNNTTKMTIGTDGYVSVTGGMKTDGTVSIGSSVGLLQFAMDGTRFNSYGFSHVHIKTSILKGSDTMISFNIRGYYYSPNTIDTDIAFYNYNPVSYVYSPTAHVKAYGGLTITMYYSSDNYVCICVEGLSTYGGFALNWINTSLIQWGGRVFTLAWSKANTASAQY